MARRLLAGLGGLIFGAFVGGLFILVLPSILGGAYESFREEVPDGLTKIMLVASLVPVPIFMLLADELEAAPIASLIVLGFILAITIVCLIFSAFGALETIATILVVAGLLSGGGTVIYAIVTK